MKFRRFAGSLQLSYLPQYPACIPETPSPDIVSHQHPHYPLPRLPQFLRRRSHFHYRHPTKCLKCHDSTKKNYASIGIVLYLSAHISMYFRVLSPEWRSSKLFYPISFTSSTYISILCFYTGHYFVGQYITLLYLWRPRRHSLSADACSEKDGRTIIVSVGTILESYSNLAFLIATWFYTENVSNLEVSLTAAVEVRSLVYFQTDSVA